MNLVTDYINELGGYEVAKERSTPWLANHGENWRNVKEATLLEYRRQHNIFEVGDLIMYENKMYEIKYIYHPEKARITDGLQGRTVYDFPRGIRHATDDEIKAVKGWRVANENISTNN